MNFLTENATIYFMFRNSGKDYNDLGRYDDCSANTNYRYLLASISKGLPISMNLGLCVPSICTAKDFNQLFKSTLITVINTMIPEFFEGVKGFNTSIQLNSDDLSFYDSRDLNKDST